MRGLVSRQCLLVPVLEVLKRGGIAAEELHALVLHGGSCRNPLVRELLTETFGDQTSLFHNTQVLETPDLDMRLNAQAREIAGKPELPEAEAFELAARELDTPPDPPRSGEDTPAT